LALDKTETPMVVEFDTFSVYNPPLVARGVSDLPRRRVPMGTSQSQSSVLLYLLAAQKGFPGGVIVVCPAK